MRLNEEIKYFFRRWTGFSIYKTLPIGIDPFIDVKRKMKNYKFRNIIDVGANVGQSAIEIRRNFPKAKIFCIEPIEDTFMLLKKNTRKLDLHYFKQALGSKTEDLEVKVNFDNLESDRNSLLNENNHHEIQNQKTEVVQVVTLEEFCESNEIEFIDYLKIDTEGYDLEVLKGSSELLKKRSIAFIEAEVGMNPKNNLHVDFLLIRQFLENYNYIVFGIYEQIHERKAGLPMLRRANVLFISG